MFLSLEHTGRNSGLAKFGREPALATFEIVETEVHDRSEDSMVTPVCLASSAGKKSSM